ncbi:DUF481 domain-containing protein [Terriglobus sp. ADX1]
MLNTMTRYMHWRMNAQVACLLVLGVGMGLKAQQAAPEKDVLIFTNGDQLSGTLERSVGGNVVFKSDMAGEITVPLSQVKDLKTHGAFAVLKHGVPVAQSKKVVPAPVEITTETVTVQETAQVPAQTVPAKDVAYVVDKQTFDSALARDISFFRGWNGAVNLGTSFTQATIHGGTISTGVSLIRQIPVVPYFRPRNRTTANFLENYGVLTTPAVISGTGSDEQAKTSIMHADAERDEYISKNVYVLATTAFDHNYSQSIALNQLYGGGFGWTVFNKPLHQLDLKADAHYQRQGHFDPSLNLNLFGSTFSEAYRRSLPYKMVLTQTAAFIPAWNDFNAYSANGGVTLAAPLFKRLALSVTALDSYINNPDPGYKKNSFTFTTGLTYALR